MDAALHAVGHLSVGWLAMLHAGPAASMLGIGVAKFIRQCCSLSTQLLRRPGELDWPQQTVGQIIGIPFRSGCTCARFV